MLLTDDIWNNDEIMEVNAEAGLSFDVLAKLSRAVIAAYEAKLREQNEPVAWVYYPKGVGEKYVTYTNPASLDLGKQADRIAYIQPLFEHPAPIPEGWQLVPIEPTEAMIDAGNDGFRSPESRRHTVSSCYKAMLNAAKDTK